MKIKICGITRLEDARFCAGAGADYLGFIQHRPSPRFVEPGVAQEIISWVYGPVPVGVFVDRPAEEVNATAGEAGFALVQLHGNESPDYCAEIAVPLIKALRVFPDTTADGLRRTMESYRGHVDYFLLDTGTAGVAGGTGRRFDWTVAAAVSDVAPLFLAGGLNAENVAAAAETVRPFAVDVSSGVESAPGVKDLDRLAAFFEAVRGVDA